jgi:hypothetical protein
MNPKDANQHDDNFMSIVLSVARSIVSSDPHRCTHCGGTEIHLVMKDGYNRLTACNAGDLRVLAAKVIDLHEKIRAYEIALNTIAVWGRFRRSEQTRRTGAAMLAREVLTRTDAVRTPTKKAASNHCTCYVCSVYDRLK